MAVADYEKKVEQIKRALGKTQAQIDAVEQRRAASQQVINEHDAARSAHVVAARVNNDPQAQQKLNTLHERIEAAQREQRDDDAALVLLRPRIQALRSALEIAESNVDREHARDLIRARIKMGLERKVAELMLAVDELMKNVRISNGEIGHAVLAFDDLQGQNMLRSQAEPFRIQTGFGLSLSAALDSFSKTSSRLQYLLDAIEDVAVPGEPEEVTVG